MAGATNERSCVMSTYSMLVRWSPGRVGMVGFRRPRIATGTLTSLIVTKRSSQSLSFFPATHVYLVVAYVVCHLIQKLISDSEHNHSVDFLLAIPQPCDIWQGTIKLQKLNLFHSLLTGEQASWRPYQVSLAASNRCIINTC